MIGFSIRSAYRLSDDDGISTEEILAIAKTISLEEFKKKCMEYGVPEDFGCDEGCTLNQYIDRYKNIPTEDMTCYISDMSMLKKLGNDDKDLFSELEYSLSGLHQTATTGSGHQVYRAQMCRAFAMLVMDECFKRGKSVCFEVG